MRKHPDKMEDHFSKARTRVPKRVQGTPSLISIGRTTTTFGDTFDQVHTELKRIVPCTRIL